MAERDTSKSRQPRSEPARSRTPAAPAGRGKDPLQAAVERLEARVLELKNERDGLAAELAAARAEIANLDAARIDAINRIDWVLDSLHTVLEDKS